MGKPVTFYVVAMLFLHASDMTTAQANFVPFGHGDVVNPISDDGSSEAIYLQQPFKYFGRVYNQIYVNNNGHLTFTQPLSAFVPYLNTGIDIIAPLWTDLKNVNGGTISYREDTSSAVLEQVTEAVHQYFPNVPFTASSAFVATWDRVPYYTGGGSATFQVVLVSNGERSFILINYGDIAETGQVWLAGYDTVDSVNSFTIPAASAPELSSSSNINVDGRWSFRVDRSAYSNFLPFGDGDVVNPISDDGSSEAIYLQQPFKYFGRVYNQIYVNNNGHLTFTQPLSAYVPYLNAGIDIIAPLWTDLFNVNGGTISYREDTSSAVLEQVTEAVHQYFPNVTFTASSAFVATWDSVPYITGGGSVTFQVVLASNGERSFILINYGDIAETGQIWLAGYDTVDSVNSFTIPAASAPELSSSSNINVDGRWSFRVDRSAYTNFLPFGDGDIVNPISDDGSSEAIYLQQPFKYFGRVYNQIYVNNNGHLTFTQPLSAYVPYLNAGIDIIAPLWTDLFNVDGGTISYREDTSSAVLAQVTEAVQQYFPNVTFTASSAFVATWDSVPYITGGGSVTFQVVLASNGERSFILINYGDIAETGQIWLAGYDTVDSVNSFTIPAASAPELSSSSNINVDGRWSFRVDGSAYSNFLPFGDGDMVNNNGHLTFTQPLSAYVPYLNAGIDIIAPLWTDLFNVDGGTISYREDTSSAVLAQVTEAVHQYFPNVTFTASSAFVATWDSVPYITGGGSVTFQVVLASNGERSFILINYGDIAETGQIWLAGYDTVDSVNSFTIPAASAPELSSSSNINVDGSWSFRVDRSAYTNFLPFGDGDVVNPISDDGSSEAIYLQQPFKYFGRVYNQIYVNNNGHLTFTQPLSAYVPYLNAGIDIIAPLWTDLFNVDGGTISYREDTSSAVLEQSVTFQVVLASNGERSFILINYGDIAETGQIWLAGYDTVDSVNSFTIPAASAPELSSSSNINVDGRWSFRVDGSAYTNFLPFGDGDVVNPISDDGSSEAIYLQQPFKYFGRVYNQIYVNNNGHLTFTQPLSAFVPYMNAGIDIIAPLWTDLYNVNGGTISYREDTSSAVLEQVTEAVHQYFPNVPFTASSAFVATWDSVPYITGGGSVTFQVVLASNGERSFILINYGDIAETGQIWLAGYDTVDSVNSFTIPAASAPELSSSSNINVDGRWSFRVDGSAYTNFLPFGDGDIVNPISDDGSSEAIYLQQPFKYFGRVYNQIYVNNNGHLTFTQPLSAYVPYLNAGIDIIAPLWTDLFNVDGGTISYREDTSSAVLAQVTEAVHQYFPNVPFTASSAFVATWDSVPYITGGGSVTFQVVLASNGERSFILINYGDIAETGQIWLAGYDTVDSVNSFTIPAASAPELSSSSNINVDGRWSFRVDGSPNSNFLPFGDGDVVNPISDDGSSEAIYLQQPFKYFGRVYNQIYVNNNGHLTFTQPLSAYVPYLNAGIDIIAPLWTDLFNVDGGTISYREDTSSAVLAQVTEAVHQYFPNVPFAASSAFVATWDRVPYFTGEGSATFQVVLVSNGDRSFILINYGDIAETGQVWLAGFDTVDSSHSFVISSLSAAELSSNSNVNDNGRWVFFVDGSHDVCDTCTENEVCQERGGVNGCACLDGQNHEIFDAVESCASSTGSMSLSRCQLFESGFTPENLHLNDPNCQGTLEHGRLVFQFDNEGHVCGTILMSNRTHFIYQNSIQSNLRSTGQSLISRERWLNITFSCAYPLIQTLSMPMGIQAEGGEMSLELPAGQGTYQVRMIPYHDAQFTIPFDGEVEIQVNQQMYVAVEVNGVDRNQIATVLDNCWATPVNDIDYHIRWSLITRECPNPEDGTVEVLQNGNDTTSHFSFRMFTFSGISDRIFLHCQVHLCLVQNGRCALSCDPGYRRRKRRSLDFHHSSAITMGL
ncbi:pancreatic secretory granule membrane major glycoprotein GP2-like [Pimephales promelas]|nr:pancreatic secretory granule membrane major glycoprotein GP2-like [Pimephales promelas]